MKKAKGSLGSWEAKIDGEPLPCVHDYWWVKGDSTPRYHDPGLTPAIPRHFDFVEQIKRAGRVILTRSKPHSDQDPVPFKRLGYVAVWTVEEIEFDQFGLKFRFVKRLFDLE
jgi:hypothetical protein